MGVPNNNGYTRDEAIRALTGPSLRLRFPVKLFDSSNRFLRWIETEKGVGKLSNDITRDAIRQFTTGLTEPRDFKLDPYTHRFGPEVWVKMSAPSATGDGDPYLKYPLGIFIAASFKRRRLRSKLWYIEISADDQAHVLTYGTSSRFTAAGGTAITAVIEALAVAARLPLGFVNIEQLPALLIPQPGREWEAGTAYIVILRDLCKLANLEWFFDERGVFTVRKWIDPAVRALAYSFIPDGKSVIYSEYEEDEGAGLATPNVIYGSVSRLQAGVSFSAVARNTNENSKFSIPRRGFEIVEKISLADAPDQPTFQSQVNRRLAEVSYGAVNGNLKTGLMPFFGPLEVIGARTEDGAIILGEFETQNDFEGWGLNQINEARVENGSLRGRSTSDSYIYKTTASTIGQSFDGSIYRYAKIVLKVNGGGPDLLDIYFAIEGVAPDTWFSNDKWLRLNTWCTGEFETYVVDMWQAVGAEKWKTGRIADFRIDPTNISNRLFYLSHVSILKHENRYIQSKFEFDMKAETDMRHGIKPIIVTF
jgi:hypothetical protein